MPETGIEPVRGLARRILSPVRLPVPPLGHAERVMGIEPTWPAWKAGVLPLNYTRINLATTYSPGPSPDKYHRPL